MLHNAIDQWRVHSHDIHRPILSGFMTRGQVYRSVCAACVIIAITVHRRGCCLHSLISYGKPLLDFGHLTQCGLTISDDTTKQVCALLHTETDAITLRAMHS